MIKNIKKLFKITASVVMGSLILWNCEPDADQLGSQFFPDGAQGTQSLYDVIAYNAYNDDTIRTDAARLQSATLGAFNEPQFGMQKSSYVSQVRLSAYTPDFGTNPVIDSAVMVIKPIFSSDSVKTTTVEDYIYPDGAVPAKKVVNTYPVAKYGNAKLNGKTIFNLKVHEVTDFLGANTEKIFSNKAVATSGVIGSKVFNGDITAIKITKDTDNSDLYVRDATLRIPMDSAFFQNKIISKAAAPELSDAASFIRYFRGIRLSVEENDGFIFNFDPNSVVINLYYKKDKVTAGVTTREQGVFPLDLGVSNTHFSQIEFNRANTPSASAVAVQDTINGMSKIYAQGMGGPGIGLKIPDATLASIKDLYNNEKIGIVSAKIRMYTDATSWTNKYQNPTFFVVKEKNLNTYLQDMNTLAYTPGYSLVRAYDLDKNPSYYDIGITQTFKNIIEKEAVARHLILNVGSYTTDASGTLAGLQYSALGEQNFNTRSYTPQRAVFVGSDPTNDKRVQLILTYGKK